MSHHAVRFFTGREAVRGENHNCRPLSGGSFNRIKEALMNHIKHAVAVLALCLAAPALAFDSSDPFGMGASAEKPAKAPREKNDGRWLENSLKNYASGAAAGAVNNAIFGAAGALNPVVAVPTILLVGANRLDSARAGESAFYSGSLVRGKVDRIVSYKRRFLFKEFGISENAPSQDVLDSTVRAIILDVDGTENASMIAFVRNDSNFQKGDIVDVNSPVGVFVNNSILVDSAHYDFNKHMPRVVNVYCKHDNPACQNDYDSSLGVMSRPNLTEFPPSQYLIDPAIIAADQAKMRQEEEEKKAARNNGGFNFL